MNKQERTIVIVLFAVLVAWGFFNRGSMKPPASPEGAAPALPAATNDAPRLAVAADAPADASPPRPLAVEPEAPVEPPPAELPPEETVELINGEVRLVVSSHGGAIVLAELLDYRETVDPASPPVQMDFSNAPSLALAGIPGLGANVAYGLEALGPSNVVIRREAAGGLLFERRLTLGADFRVAVEDRFLNRSAAPIELPSYRMGLGPMRMIQSKARTPGISYLGLDTLAAAGGSRVRHWGKKLSEAFGIQSSRFSCAKPNAGGAPLQGEMGVGQPVDWVAAKNKYFVQILAPAMPAEDAMIRVTRDAAHPDALTFEAVSADMVFAGLSLEAGESAVREASYYVGPKKYALLKELGTFQGEVMEFGWWDWFRWICRTLLWTLNAIYAVIPNYGIAIILVTVIVRVLFWPITHKGTESMKRMKEIQPLVTQLREKHKDSPQKLNQEMMALYKQHKVNPMAGCLPMVVQIPVFIALFIVLRSAVELRFAGFLWIRDLSEPEGLLAAVLPIPLNILPLIMTATTILQQKLTPTAGDPQQQKIMMFMPVIFLFLFYNMPSALVLYWSVSQCLAIVQLLWQQKRAEDKKAAAGAGGSSRPVIEAPVRSSTDANRAKRERSRRK